MPSASVLRTIHRGLRGLPLWTGIFGACIAFGESADQARPPSESVAATASEAGFTDSAISIAIRGNDGSTPGDVLFVGQTSRLLGFVLAVQRAPDGEYRGMAHEVAGARLRWRSLAPEILAVDSLGRVRALRPGRGAIEAVAVFAQAGGRVRDTMPFRVLPPDPLLSRLRVTDVSAPGTNDAYQTCAVTQPGDVVCLRPVGRVVGTDEEQSRREALATQIFRAPEGNAFQSVVTGIGHVCALTVRGEAYCWGDNQWGQVGEGSNESRLKPTAIGASAAFTKLSAGRARTCGVTKAGQVLCWGAGMNDALGPAGTDRCTILMERRPHHPEPEPIPCARTPKPVLLPGIALDIGLGNDHTCALTTQREVFCWGWNYNVNFKAGRPTRIADGGARLVQIASGSRHVCGLDAAGRAYCWGRNWEGQLGAGVPREGSARLVPVMGAPSFRAIAGGDDHTCGIAESGAAFCWGKGFDGQLGVASFENVDRPALVSGGHVWRAITAGFSHTCAITNDGALFCWGSGLGFRAEPGSFHEQPEPFLVAGWR